ncbi:TorD/DmsD family molecular chaperone [Vreelandella jeotgali]|uniref:TorD/DmsD family molecular chaperone n=1 Tax=Vreelandella jeotgali TaxID=553386 RepID=UPI00035C128D|nr:molecular chaperone TorD family protein [Halomonas jeotgali]
MNQPAVSDTPREAMPDTAALIAAAEWLSDVFRAPPPGELHQADAQQEQPTLRWLGRQLDAEAPARALEDALTRQPPEGLGVHLQRRYTALFEGIFQHRAVLPYESAWQPGADGPALGGPSVASMDATLRALDLHVSEDCCEPPDHLAIELEALATALRDGQTATADDLTQRLASWVPPFNEALNARDANGFYAAAGNLLTALIDRAGSAPETADTAAVNERRQGEYA